MKTPGYFFNRSAVRVCLMGFALATASAQAFAADVWIACDGNVMTKKGSAAATTAAISDFYAFNDDVKMLYKYSPTRKTLDTIPTSVYDPKTIGWKSLAKAAGMQGVQWDGTFDRGKMSLDMTRVDGDETMVWKQSCKPSSAQPLQ